MGKRCFQETFRYSDKKCPNSQLEKYGKMCLFRGRYVFVKTTESWFYARLFFWRCARKCLSIFTITGGNMAFYRVYTYLSLNCMPFDKVRLGLSFRQKTLHVVPRWKKGRTFGKAHQGHQTVSLMSLSLPGRFKWGFALELSLAVGQLYGVQVLKMTLFKDGRKWIFICLWATLSIKIYDQVYIKIDL